MHSFNRYWTFFLSEALFADYIKYIRPMLCLIREIAVVYGEPVLCPVGFDVHYKYFFTISGSCFYDHLNSADVATEAQKAESEFKSRH